MEKLMEKISNYDFFNNLFPGVLFGMIIEYLFSLKISSNNIGIVLTIYYFIGLVISRIGSLIIFPILEKIKFIKKSNYDDYISACMKDEKIGSLAETANMYRSLFVAAMLIVILVIIYIINNNLRIVDIIMTISSACVGVLFLFSYRKQTEYIDKRVKRSNKK